jgi:translation initiation factor 1
LSDVIYSTGLGARCAGCRRPVSQCVCQSATPARLRAAAGAVRVSRQTQGRAGKGVTIINGLPLSGAALTTLAGELKRFCGSGGTVKGAVIEIQGEHRDRLVAELIRRGFAAKRAGG